MASQDEPSGGNPAPYGDPFRGKARDGPMHHLTTHPDPEPNRSDAPQVSSVVKVPGKAKAESNECLKFQALRARLKHKVSGHLLQWKACVPLNRAWTVWGGQDTTEARSPCVSTVGVRRQSERKEAMEKILREFIDRDLLEPCHSFCFVVHKKLAGEWQLVVDYRGLNAQTQHASYTLPEKDMPQKELRQRIFTAIDLNNGYVGPLQWKVMPMGVTNGNTACQRILENLLEPMRDFEDPFVNDVIIASGDPSMS